MAKTFEIGQVVATKAVWELMDESKEFNDFVSGCLSRYILYDWGDTCEEDWESNNKAALGDGRRNELKFEGFDIWHRPGTMSQFIPVANTGSVKKEDVIEEDIPDEIEVPDIPEIPSVSEPEPVMDSEKHAVHSKSAIEVVKKIAKFNGRKTGFGYIATSENDYLTIRDDGIEFKINTNILEAFVDELIDITEEVKKFKNSL